MPALPSLFSVSLLVLLTMPGIAQGQQAEEKKAEKRANRLAKETSPYLLLHAHNPVDWHPWGEEALKKARDEQKLIFLSIGYSSCYWCHVMERESFMDEQIAALLNEHFVCIKVDREERPDIDDIYMSALQALTQRGGGWPLSMFLTPEAHPFIGGTYFPPRTVEGRIGFDEVLKKIHDAWQEDPDSITQQGEQLAKHVRESLRQRPVVLGQPNQKMLEGLMAELGREYDPEHGGFGYSDSQPKMPKFPQPSNLVFLLDRMRRAPGDSRPRSMLLPTLDKMAQGGIRDHLGGGFHRYSTDRSWHIPHFEKMLYDNGQLAGVYAAAYELTGRGTYRRVAEQICDFILREMTDPRGGFYAALDAETDGEEGKFYVWKFEEFTQALSEEEMALLSHTYGLGAGANFEGHYALLQREPPARVAKDRGLSEDEMEERLAPVRQKLLDLRAKRERPLTDNKVLASWNGLAISGLADTGRILKNERYLQAAARAAQFVLDHMLTDQGRLQRSYVDGEVKLNAYLDDYAFLAEGLIALHKATGETRWLEAADKLTAKQIELFWDERAGGFFFTSHDHETLFARSKNPADGALPGGNSVSAANLLYLADKLERPDYRRRAQQTIHAATPLLDGSPLVVPRMAVALAKLLE